MRFQCFDAARRRALAWGGGRAVAAMGCALALLSILALSGCVSGSASDGATGGSPAATTPLMDPAIEVQPDSRNPLLVGFRIVNSDDFDSTSLVWQFDDGTQAQEPAPTHRFATAGAHRVTLQFVDRNRQSGSETQAFALNAPPTVVISGAGVIDGSEGMGFYFQARAADPDSSLSAAAARWSFGDGASATGERVEHFYSAEGRYTVEVSVTDPDGAVAANAIVAEVERVEPPIVVAPAPSPEPVSDPIAPSPTPAPEPEPAPAPEPEPSPSEPVAGGSEPEPQPAPSDSEPSPSEPAPAPAPAPDPSGALIPVLDRVVIDFEQTYVWMDGALLAQSTNAFAGAASLQVNLEQSGAGEAALEALLNLVSPFLSAGETHIQWQEKWDADLALDAAALRPALDSFLASLDPPLGAAEDAFVREVVSQLEAQATSLAALSANTWFCLGLEIRPGLAGSGSLVFRLNGVVAASATELSFPEISRTADTLRLLFPVLGGLSTAARTAWVDQLTVDSSPLACP